MSIKGRSKICPHGFFYGLCAECGPAKISIPAPKPYADHRLETPKRTPTNYVELIMKLDGVTRIHWTENRQDTEHLCNSIGPYIMHYGPAYIVEVGIFHPLFKGELIFKVNDLKQVYDTLKLMPLCF